MGGVALVGWLPGGLGGRWFEGSSRLASARAATEFMSCGDKGSGLNPVHNMKWSMITP